MLAELSIVHPVMVGEVPAMYSSGSTQTSYETWACEIERDVYLAWLANLSSLSQTHVHVTRYPVHVGSGCLTG
jgi:hypothetical protein